MRVGLRTNRGQSPPHPRGWISAWSLQAALCSNPWVTLSVHVFTRSADDEFDILETPHVETLAGFESWRKTVWGSERVRALGAVFFPVLASDDLYVSPGQVEAFGRECELLRANLEVVAQGVDPGNPRSAYGLVVDGKIERREPDDAHAAFVQTVSRRLANIELAVQRASQSGAGVVIW